MEALCSECNKTYIEHKNELHCLIGEVPMLCYECVRKYYPPEQWICTHDALPPCDGLYDICNTPGNEHNVIGRAYYDGYGFLYDDIYRPVLYWRHVKPLEKKYGKVKNGLETI